MYNRIMVPTDGSGFDREAIRVAVRIADESRADIRLVRVVSSVTLLGLGEPFEVTDVTMEAKRAELSVAERELEALAGECRALGDSKVSIELLDGPTAEMLEGYAQRNRIDLIVISSHGRGGMSRLTLGSVTDSLIRRTQIPVLVVKPVSSYLNPRASAQVKSIVVPLDGSTLAEQILPAASLIAMLEGASMTLLHVLGPQRFRVKSSPTDEHPSHDCDIEVAQSYLSRIADRLRRGNLIVDTQVIVGEDVAASIGDFAAREHADLIAIATHGRGGLARMIRGSVADAVTRTARTSMLVLRPDHRIQEQPRQERGGRMHESPGLVA